MTAAAAAPPRRRAWPGVAELVRGRFRRWWQARLPRSDTVLLTQRTAHLHDHAGQISFPGGRVETEDQTPVHTALRETEEEIGLHARHVELLGRLPQYRTGTGLM